MFCQERCEILDDNAVLVEKTFQCCVEVFIEFIVLNGSVLRNLCQISV